VIDTAASDIEHSVRRIQEKLREYRSHRSL